MPISTQCFRQNIGCHDAREKGIVTDKIIQRELNNIAASQAGKVPQKLGWMTVLALLSVVSNSTWRSGFSEPHISSSDYNDENDRQDNKDVGSKTANVSSLVGFRHNIRLCQGFDTHFSSTDITSLEYKTEINLDLVSLRQAGKAIFHSLKFNACRLSKLLNNYDVLVFPGAEAAIANRTATVELDDVSIRKIDCECINERRDLSVSDILIKILDTIKNCVTNLSLEIQVVNAYRNGEPCPTQSEVEFIERITKVIDSLATSLMGFFDGLKVIVILQTLVAPAIRMAINDLTGRNVSFDDIEELSGSIIGYSRGVAHISSIQEQPIFGIKTVGVPKHIRSESGYIYMRIKGCGD